MKPQSIQQKVQDEIALLSQKKRKDMLSWERVRAFTTKTISESQTGKRVWIEKENGGQRPLGIPTIKDRVVQQACKLVIEPIFEAGFNESSHGFRPKHSAKDAIIEIKNNLKQGKQEVYDADLSKYFDTIPHDRLEITLKERIADPRVLHLIKLWLKVPIVEEDGKYTGGKSNTKGTPQGGVISPFQSGANFGMCFQEPNPKRKYGKRSNQSCNPSGIIQHTRL